MRRDGSVEEDQVLIIIMIIIKQKAKDPSPKHVGFAKLDELGKGFEFMRKGFDYGFATHYLSSRIVVRQHRTRGKDGYSDDRPSTVNGYDLVWSKNFVRSQ